jgi:hypothetical protein
MAVAKLRQCVGRLADKAIQTTTGVLAYWAARRRARAAMSLYLELSRLSDAELARRGLTRDDVSTFLSEARVREESTVDARHRRNDAR